jgi:hypothetical protein
MHELREHEWVQLRTKSDCAARSSSGGTRCADEIDSVSTYMPKACYQCGQDNPAGQLFCGQCGAALTLKDYVAKQVESQLAVALKDRQLMETESTVRVFERVWNLAKIVIGVAAIPVVVVAGLGIYKGSDLWSTVNKAKETVVQSAESTRKDIKQTSAKSVADIQIASAAAVSANKSSSQTALTLSSDLKKTAAHVKGELAQESSSIRKQVIASTAELEAANKLQPEFETMRNQLAKATSDLAAQQKVISSSEDFAKHVFSSHQFALFTLDNFVQSNAVVVPPPSSSVKNTVVYLLLPAAPIPGTLQLQYHIFVQPPNSYGNFHNLVFFFWGDPADNLKQKQLSVSYFPDTSDKELIHSLSLKDGRVYADDQPLPKFGQPDPEFKGNKWSTAPPASTPAPPS